MILIFTYIFRYLCLPDVCNQENLYILALVYVVNPTALIQGRLLFKKEINHYVMSCGRCIYIGYIYIRLRSELKMLMCIYICQTLPHFQFRNQLNNWIRKMFIWWFVIVCCSFVVSCWWFVVIWWRFVVCWCFVVLCGCLVVVCGRLLVVWGRLMVICGCLFMACGRLLLVYGLLLVVCDSVCSFVVVGVRYLF